MKALRVLAGIVLIPSVSLAAPPQPGWQVLADCAAGYRADARIKAPDRTATMSATISDRSADYVLAASDRYRRQAKVSEHQAEAYVQSYVDRKSVDFDRISRAALDRFVGACPKSTD